MTFNWGHGIALFYVIFVGTLLTVLIKSFSVDHSLVVEDYYAKDLAYQSQYDKSVNSIKSDNLNVNYDSGNGQIVFEIEDASPATGSIQFYRASDKTKDFIVPISSNNMDIPVSHLSAGKWRVKVDWTIDGKAYYQEKDFYF